MDSYAVGFDFDHTLGNDHGLERTAFYLLADELGVPLDLRDRERRAQIEALLGEFRTEKITLDEAVKLFASSIGRPDPGPAAAARYRELCYRLVSRTEATDGARALLDRLAVEGVAVAILTNGWSPLQQKKIAHALGFAGPVLVSDEIGAAKPERYAFERLVQVLNVPVERCWYVGDNPRADVCGALAAGMRGVWFETGEQPYPSDLPPPTARIAALAELPRILPGPAFAAENPRL